jgi:endonuclease/exonuclease/phosphatase family metal-dependent hydrolase
MTRPRRQSAVIAVAASALALGTALAPAASVQAGPPDASIPGTPARTATVMTRNLYLGAELGPILAALATGNSAAIVGAATQTWNSVQATRPEERMAAIADEIVASDAAVVGLQEVTTWTTFAYNPQTGAVSNPTVTYDFLALLLDALADRGAGYREVGGATAHNFASPPIPVLASPTATFPTRAVRLADRDVVIARDDVRVGNARAGTYQNIVSFPFGGTVLPVARGWGSADVQVGRAVFRFVNSHLEAFGIPGVDAEQVRVAQVGELLAAQAAIAAQAGDLPTVYVGDYNSRAPDAPAYSRLLAGVGMDTWPRTHPGDAGLTCCFDALVRDPADPLTSRIDLVLVSPDVKAPRATVVGDDPADMTVSGLWPSDHAGVVARLVFPARR